MNEGTAAAPLFAGWEETMVWSCLQDHMGYIISDGENPPVSAQIVVGDFCFFAGKPNAKLIKKAGAPILIPRTPKWCQMIEDTLGNKVEKAARYAIKKEPGIFNREKLSSFIEALPEQYTLSRIEESHYDTLIAEPWSRDFCSLFQNWEDYKNRGLGVIALLDGTPVSGASSYSIYTGGIEIEIDTKKEHRRQGLAAACGAKLILECLDRGLYPSWDAHDLRSVALAEKLGYHMDKPYTVYYLV